MHASPHATTLVSVMHEYFELRARLGTLHSEFKCDPECARPGCKNPDMHISVTVFDLIGAAFDRNEPIDEIYFKNYSLGLVPFENQPSGWIHPVSVKLKKPCPYLKEEKCGIYGVRPLPCIFFPEWYAVDGTLTHLAGQPRFKDYHCLRGDFQVPEKRAESLRKAAWMMDREVLISDRYLYPHSPFLIDFGHLQEAFAHVSGKASDPGSEEESPSGRSVPFERLEQAFENEFGSSPLPGEIEEKILRLRDPKLQGKLFEDLNNRSLVKKLIHQKDDRPFVFQFANGRWAAKRKSLLSAEQRFIW